MKNLFNKSNRETKVFAFALSMIMSFVLLASTVNYVAQGAQEATPSDAVVATISDAKETATISDAKETATSSEVETKTDVASPSTASPSTATPSESGNGGSSSGSSSSWSGGSSSYVSLPNATSGPNVVNTNKEVSNNAGPGIPKTADRNSLMLQMMFAISALGVAAFAYKLKKEEK